MAFLLDYTSCCLVPLTILAIPLPGSLTSWVLQNVTLFNGSCHQEHHLMKVLTWQKWMKAMGIVGSFKLPLYASSNLRSSVTIFLLTLGLPTLGLPHFDK